ncbi:MAG: Dabb family protein [Caulobacterales bacterium]
MIRHIVFFSCKPGHSPQEIVRGLSVLTGIEHARKVEIALNEKVDQIGNDVDIVVYAEFDSVEALRAFKAHPLYDDSTRNVRPLRELRFAADFDVAKATTTLL